MYSIPEPISYIVLSLEGLVLKTCKVGLIRERLYGSVGALSVGVRGCAPRSAPMVESAKLALASTMICLAATTA